MMPLATAIPLDLLAVRVFNMALVAVPALVRQWFVYDCARQVRFCFLFEKQKNKRRKTK